MWKICSEETKYLAERFVLPQLPIKMGGKIWRVKRDQLIYLSKFLAANTNLVC